MAEMDVKFALGVVLMLNFAFFLAQLGIDVIGGDEATNYFNYDGSMLSKYDDGDYNLKEFDESDLPESESGVSPEGNIFTDLFKTVKNWFLDVSGGKYILGIVNAIPNFLKAIGLPNEISFAIGFVWHAMTVFLVVMLLKGGS